jgi:hypothetical protein
MKHGHGNDGLATASVAHRGMDLFDHRHGGEERGDGHQHHQSPATASDPQDGLIAVIGGSAMAAGDASAVNGFVENFVVDQGAYSIAMGEAIFQASAHSSGPGGGAAAADTFLDVSGADFIIEQEVGQSKHGPHDASALSELDYLAIDIHGWSPRTVRSSSSWISPSVTISRLGRNRSRALSHRWSQWPRRTAPTPSSLE